MEGTNKQQDILDVDIEEVKGPNYMQEGERRAVDFNELPPNSSFFSGGVNSARLDGTFSGGRFSAFSEKDNGIGEKRVNDDGFLIGQLEKGKYFIVILDGISQGGRGSLATQIAADKIDEVLRNGGTLLEAFRQADNAVYRAQENKRGAFQTVAVGVLIDGDEAELVSVGDCEAVFADESVLQKATIPENVPGELLADGYISRKQYWNAYGRNMVKNTIGMGANFDYKSEKIPLSSGDKISLSSDGINDMRSAHQAAQNLRISESPKEAIDNTIKRQEELGGPLMHGKRVVIEDVDEEGNPFTVHVKKKADNMSECVYEHGLKHGEELHAGHAKVRKDIDSVMDLACGSI